MTWRGALRSMQSAARQMEREAQRRQRELERQARDFEKMQVLEQAAYEVHRYENYVDRLRSIHKECGARWDWQEVYDQESPEPPIQMQDHEDAASTRLRQFSPNLFDKLFGWTKPKIAALNDAVVAGRRQDKVEFAEALEAHEEAEKGWQEARALAKRILGGDQEAYLEAIEETQPFSEIRELGSSFSLRVVDKFTVEATLLVNDADVVPSEVKSLLQSGKLSTKKMPKGAYQELYQDYVCSCALRVAGEILALLPVQMVIVSALGNLLNTKTGYIEEQTILSVAIPRETFSGLNLQTVDPSDSMNNFVHRMDFKKTSGFRIVQKIDALSLRVS